MRFWNLSPDPETPADGVLEIDGPIDQEDWFGDATTPKEFKQALAGLKNVTVHINSPGGDVMAGAEIYSALLEHRLNGRGKVTVIITALAASAASVIAMAGDEILISPVAYMMIHNPWSLAMGDAHDMRKEAKILDEIREGLITAYQRKTGMDREELRRMVDSETWMSATTCVEKGFADGIYGGEIQAAACAGGGLMTKATPEAITEMCARWEASRGGKNEDPEEEPEETEDPDETEEEAGENSENAGQDAAQGDDPGADPEEDDPEDPEEDPEETNDPEDPEEDDPDPDDPEEDPEKDTEDAIRADIARRAAILAGLEWQQ